MNKVKTTKIAFIITGGLLVLFLALLSLDTEFSWGLLAHLIPAALVALAMLISFWFAFAGMISFFVLSFVSLFFFSSSIRFVLFLWLILLATLAIYESKPILFTKKRR